MKYLVCSILVTLLLVPLVWSQTRAIQPVRIEATTTQDESISYIYEESHALIIGVSDYTNGWSKLAGVKEDVIEVQRALEDNGFEVQLLEDPDKQQLEATIEDFIFEKGADPENRLLIYYAGHGHTKTLGYGGEMGYLVPADAPLPKKGRDIAFQRSVMSMQRIEEVAKNTSAKHVLFMFDACFAGSVFLATRAAPSYIEVFTEEPVRQFITSGSADQEVPDNSIFRRAFVDALAGSADFDKDGYLTGSELGTYIQKRTAEDWKGELTPQYGKLQDPNLNKGDFVFKIGKSANQSSTASTVTANSDLAAQAWEVVKDSTNPKILEEFIRMFPSAPQRNLAKLKLMTLESSSPIESTENLENVEVFAGDAAIQQVLKNKYCIGCNLAGAYLWKAELQGANLSGADLTGAYLRGANLVGVNFKNAKLNGADLKGANLQRASFCNTSMPDGSISNMGCEKTDQATPESETAFGLSGEAAKKKLFRDNECVGCDLNGTSLSGNILRGVNLTKATLRGADLRGADLHEAKLRESDLRGADLQRADLQGADLSYSEMPYADLNEADLQGADLHGANLTNAKFCKTIMPDGSINNKDCAQSQANMHQSSKVLSGEAAKKKLLETKECIGCDLSKIILYRVHVYSANLKGANLSGANLSGSIFYASNFSGANLTQANLNGASLRDSDFSDANLSNVLVREARLQGTIFKDNDFKGTNFTGANLSNAKLKGANLSAAVLNSVNFHDADLSSANLTRINFAGSHLNGANLNRANLEGASLKGAGLNGTSFYQAKFCNTTMPDGSINNDDC